VSRPTTEERFWAKVDRNGPIPAHRPELGSCWVWTAGKSRGYGLFHGFERPWRAHRLSYLLCVGNIPAGLLVLHRCDNPSCVRPDHLFVGTDGVNIRDCIAKERRSPKQRFPRGEHNQGAKLAPAQVAELRRLAREEGWPLARLAERFGVHKGQAGKIVQGRKWAHLQ
jgi:hypothetical protein